MNPSRELLVWTVAEARAADAAALAMGIPGAWLMEAAGAAVARRVASYAPRRVLVLAGPGQNGGDGLVAARRLALTGFEVAALVPQPGRFPEASAVMASAWAAGVARWETADVEARLPGVDVVVDAVLGTGQNRPLGAPWNDVWSLLPGHRVVAVDLPSGVAADTGALLGNPVAAVETVALGALKPAHILQPAAAFMGRLTIADIGLPWRRGEHFRLAVPEAHAPSRPETADKYDRGKVIVVGGSPDYSGAPGLAAIAAMRVGAGYVEIWCGPRVAERVRFLPAVVRVLNERPNGALVLDDEHMPHLGRARAIVLGPGAVPDAELIRRVRATEVPTVVDAGGLDGYAAAGRPDWPQAVFTPHVREAGRMLGKDAEWVAAHRATAVRDLVAATGGTVLLKGRRTLIGGVGTPLFVNWPGGGELATAGTGDVLGGMIGGLLAGGMIPEAACRQAAWWHGLAGERMSWRRGPVGGSAEDLLEAVAEAALDHARPADWPQWML